MVLSITTELGRFEEFFSETVYPVWPLWLAAGIAALIAAAYVAYRLGWHRVALRHALLSSVIGALFIAGVGSAGYYTVSPLFDRNTVCEASPVPGADAGSDKCDDVAIAATMPPTGTPTAAPSAVPSAAPTAAPPTATPFTPFVVRKGEWQSADDFHFANGQALLIETAPDTYTLRFENFSVRNGPDVFVLLSPTNGYDSAALNLGSLKGTDGAFNYDVPPGTDVSQYTTAVIWCRQFEVVFGTAQLA